MLGIHLDSHHSDYSFSEGCSVEADGLDNRSIWHSRDWG